MAHDYTFDIYDSIAGLPDCWDTVAASNIFLSTRYLQVLQESAPANMSCHFIGIYDGNDLVGVALTQFLDLNLLESFGERDRCLKTSMRNFIFKRFSSHVLFVGNNMLSGQNAYVFADDANKVYAIRTLKQAAESLRRELSTRGRMIHLLTFKDFDETEAADFDRAGFHDYFRFSTQPNMVLANDLGWASMQDYVDSLTKKYRDQFKRAHKKMAGVEKRKLALHEIVLYEKTIYDLYRHVAQNAPFNTFFLAENHFRTLKRQLGDDFLFYGYFEQGKLIGFNTLIRNGCVLDTYFLGYDEAVQREKMLYLNMLYDMINYFINKGFSKIIFARTALEIKSSVGAKPMEMIGFMQHGNGFINKRLARIFGYLEPETPWQQRHPFKAV